MYVDFAAFSLETVKERFSFKVILFVSTFKGIGPAFQKLLIYIKKLFRWSAQEKHSCLKLMVVWSKDTDCSTLFGLVLLQDVLEVVEELVLVDPPVVSERRGKCIEQGFKYRLLTHRQLQNKQTNKPIQHRKQAHQLLITPVEVDGVDLLPDGLDTLAKSLADCRFSQ